MGLEVSLQRQEAASGPTEQMDSLRDEYIIHAEVFTADEFVMQASTPMSLLV